jgi:hypothetical protein
MGRPDILIKSFSFQFCFLVIRNSVSFDPFFIYLEQCFPNFLSLRTKARRRGLVVKEKTHVQEVVSSNPGPAVETIYHAPLIWIKSMKAKIVEK